MEHEPSDRTEPLASYLAKRLVREHRARPVSFYLMFALLAVVVLGGQVVYFREDPRKLAFFLSLNFIVCFVIMYRAIVDGFDIMRGHMREQRNLFGTTLGEEEFVETLGKQMSERDDQS